MTYVVNNHAQLAAAAAAADSELIYLNEDITIEAPINIPPGKEALVFDGTYNGIRHCLTDMNSELPTNTLGIQDGSSIRLTFQHMDMVGRNYYGIPYIRDFAADTSGVTVVYTDIHYEGAQICYNPLGTTRFEDCDIIIRKTGISDPEEAGEVNRLEFSGTNSIIQSSAASYAVFWFRGTVGTAVLRVLPGASVTVTSTDGYFMFNLNLVLGIPSTPNPVTCDIQEGASLIINAHHGFSRNQSHRVAAFRVGTDAAFRYIQQAANESYSSMYLNGSFIASRNASVYMQADFAASSPLLHFMTGTGLPLTLDYPKSFVLYNRDAVPIALSGATRSFTLGGGQINYWLTASGFPGAGGFEDEPDEKWHRPDWTEFNITGLVSAADTAVTGTSLTAAEQQDLPPIEALNFQTMRVLSAGDLPIYPHLMADDGRPVSGHTDPGAEVVIAFSAGGTDYELPATADADGAYSADPQMIVPAGTVIHIKANRPFFITETRITVTAAVGEIVIQHAPHDIIFKLPSVHSAPILLGRKDPLEPVKVLDSRGIPEAWTLSASITGPLTADTGEVLSNALVFRGLDGTLYDLSETPTLVHTNAAQAGETDVYWEAEYGILVRVSEPIRADAKYSTNIHWVLGPD